MRTTLRGASTRGQSSVEFAVVGMVFIVILLGALELTLVGVVSSSLKNAAREGARYASTAPGDDTNAITAATRTVPSFVAPVTVAVSYPTGLKTSGNPVLVTVQHQHKIITPLIARIIGNQSTLSLSASSQMVIE